MFLTVAALLSSLSCSVAPHTFPNNNDVYINVTSDYLYSYTGGLGQPDQTFYEPIGAVYHLSLRLNSSGTFDNIFDILSYFDDYDSDNHIAPLCYFTLDDDDIANRIYTFSLWSYYDSIMEDNSLILEFDIDESDYRDTWCINYSLSVYGHSSSILPPYGSPFPNYSIMNDIPIYIFNSFDSGGTIGILESDFATNLDLYFAFYFINETTFQYSIDSYYGNNQDGIWQSGYDSGYDVGHDTGYNEGYTLGNNTGFNNGYSEGIQVGAQYDFLHLFGAIADTPIMILNQLLGFEVFGVKAISILMTMITGSVAIFLIRKFI